MPKPLLILYGSVTGNAEYCAEKAAKLARQRGYDPTLENMGDTEPEVLNQFDTALIITSTFGDGEPPSGTEDFYEGVVVARRVRLTSLRYAVLALGDTVYEHFCKIGRDYDAVLESLGATRFHDRQDCDSDFEDACDAWLEGVFSALAEERAAMAA